MLIKRSQTMTPRSNAVKNLGRAFASLAFVGALSAASTASAFSTQLTERVITVEISAAEFATPEGAKRVHEKLELKAKKACKADSETLRFTGQSLSECTADLLNQFIESSDIESLNAVHASQKVAETKKLALSNL